MQKRLLWTFVLCMGFFLLWHKFVVPLLIPPAKPHPPKNSMEQQNEEATTNRNTGENNMGKEYKEEEVLDEPALNEQFEEQIYMIRTDTLIVEFSNKGGAITSLTIDYPSGDGIKMIDNYDPGNESTYAVNIPFDGLDRKQWNVAKHTEDTIVFRAKGTNGLLYTKEYKVNKDIYSIDLKIAISNPTKKNAEIILPINLFNGNTTESNLGRYVYALTGEKSGGLSLDYYNLSDSVKEVTGCYGAGIKNRYYSLFVYPARPKDSILFDKVVISPVTILKGSGKLKSLSVSSESEPISLSTGETDIYEYIFYAGPIKKSEIVKVSEELHVLEDYTGSDFIASIILGLLGIFHSLSGNYGIAIILTTLIVRLCLFPISAKGQVSMHKLQKLKPQLDLLRKKYKDDQRKFALEQMKLMKKHKIGYGATCWGMLIQLPVFFGMYSVFDTAIELRHAEAFFWINDLSQPDRLYVLSSPVTLLFFTLREINLLPIIMTITWVVQSVTAPRSEDPNMRTQQKIFMFMPVVFGFLCYSFASGLSLYFFANSLFGIIEQRIIKTKLIKKSEVLNHT